MPDEFERDPATARLLERADLAARADGLSGSLEDMDEGDFRRLLDGLARDDGQGGTRLPENWRASLGTIREHRRLRADTDNAALAARGEVFAPEDDA